MIRVLISLILITTLNTSLFACKTPKELMDNYFQDFNSANSKKIEKNFSFPFMVIQNGKKTIHNELSSFYDFENIKDTGWKESVINSVILILKKNKSIIEVPIKYEGRSYEEGKKIKPIDGMMYLINTIKYKIY